jgi:proline iminopeptidase
MRRTEGFVPVKGGNVWYEIVGEGAKTPLILVHGGPGYPHDYLKPLEDLADERQIVFYDQLGCGNSDVTTDTSLWSIEEFVSELGRLIQFLGIKKYHLLGHSWGAAVVASFALTKPEGLISLIMSDPYVSTPHWIKDAKRLISSLPQEMQTALASSNIESPEYKNASKEYYFRFVKRYDVSPDVFAIAAGKMNIDLYKFMWGTEEFRPTGSLLNYDLTPKFSEITTPILLLCGRYDEATPEASTEYQKLLPQAQLKVFENSAHYPFWNEPKEYIQTVREFLGSFE